MNSKEIGKKIKEIRKSKGITQKKLGNILGYTEAHISHIEAGNRNLGIEDLKKVAIFFNLTLSCFLTSQPVINFRATGDENGEIVLDENIWNDFKKVAKNQINK